jgi:hypothetical protein
MAAACSRCYWLAPAAADRQLTRIVHAAAIFDWEKLLSAHCCKALKFKIETSISCIQEDLYIVGPDKESKFLKGFYLILLRLNH